jgi:GNAT superfamily N-acetyltransferase
MIELRQGNSFEYDPVLADLLWETDPDLFEFVYRGDKATWRRHLASEWAGTPGLQSRDAAIVALSGSGVVGILISFDAESMLQRGKATYARLMAISTHDMGREIGRALTAMNWLFPTVPPDALCVFNLSVAEPARGGGIGRMLIEAAAARARDRGLASIHLDTAVDRPAVEFYRRLGFSPLVETRLCRLRDGETVPPHFRMVLDL